MRAYSNGPPGVLVKAQCLKSKWHFSIWPFYRHFSIWPFYRHFSIWPFYGHFSIWPFYGHFSIWPFYQAHYSIWPFYQAHFSIWPFYQAHFSIWPFSEHISVWPLGIQPLGLVNFLSTIESKNFHQQPLRWSGHWQGVASWHG